MRGTIIFALLVLAAPIALAQEEEPTVNDTDYDTTTPPDDQSYIDDAEMESSTMSDSDFDTSMPADDQSYINDEVEGETTGSDTKSDTPGLGVLALLAGVGAAAIGLRRRG